MDIKHIWWDLDGTLYKMPPEFEQAKMKRRLELFSEIVDKEVNDDLRKEYLDLYEEHGSHSAVFMSLGKPKDFWQIEHQKIDIIPYIKADQRTIDMFQRFKGLPYSHSIFTNRKVDYVQGLLAHLGIPYELFKSILTNEDISHPKPHLEGFQKMVELAGVDSEQILYVGDRIKTDILPANELGMKTALVWSDKQKTEADYTFPHIADIISLFE